jgi:3-methyladenine DNA glycosylase AlkD
MELLLHSRPVRTVFDLLGDKEDDITYSLGWALAQSDRLVRRLLARSFAVGDDDTGDLAALLLQETVLARAAEWP